jgi:hypothetical protein
MRLRPAPASAGLALAALIAGCGGGSHPAGKQPSYDVSKPPVARAVGPSKSPANTAGVSAGARAARKGPFVGISDQDPDTFGDPRFRALGMGFARLITPWNAILTEPDRLDGWLQAAKAAGIEPLVAFNHARGDQCPARPCTLPPVAQYAAAFRAFRSKYPWVRSIQPWNEANHQSQPTGRNPKRAAQFYNAVRANCPGCTITAADVLDSPNLKRWLPAFAKTARGKPRLWGLHNYTDTNRFRSAGTKAMLKLVKGQVWLTETGGIVAFTTASGKVALKHDETRARRAIDFLFKLARTSRRISRVYVYQWRKTAAGDRFDAGLVAPDNAARASLSALRRQLGLPPANLAPPAPPAADQPPVDPGPPPPDSTEPGAG